MYPYLHANKIDKLSVLQQFGVTPKRYGNWVKKHAYNKLDNAELHQIKIDHKENTEFKSNNVENAIYDYMKFRGSRQMLNKLNYWKFRTHYL